MNDEKAWRKEFAEATGVRKTRMRTFAAKAGSKGLRGELRRAENRKRRRSNGMKSASQTLKRQRPHTASGKSWKVLATAKARAS